LAGYLGFILNGNYGVIKNKVVIYIYLCRHNLCYTGWLFHLSSCHQHVIFLWWGKCYW